MAHSIIDEKGTKVYRAVENADWVILAILLSITANAQNIKEIRKLEPLPRDLEIQLGALPLHLRDNATVYVLNPDKEKSDSDLLRRQSAFVRS